MGEVKLPRESVGSYVRSWTRSMLTDCDWPADSQPQCSAAGPVPQPPTQAGHLHTCVEGGQGDAVGGSPADLAGGLLGVCIDDSLWGYPQGHDLCDLRLGGAVKARAQGSQHRQDAGVGVAPAQWAGRTREFDTSGGVAGLAPAAWRAPPKGGGACAVPPCPPPPSPRPPPPTHLTA